MLHERGVDICHETVRFWWNRFGPMFAAEIRKRRVHHQSYSNWRWHLDEVFVRINGETHYLWRAVDHEGRSARGLRHETAGSPGCTSVYQTCDEAVRSAEDDRDGPTKVLPGSDECDWEWR